MGQIEAAWQSGAMDSVTVPQCVVLRKIGVTKGWMAGKLIAGFVTQGGVVGRDAS